MGKKTEGKEVMQMTERGGEGSGTRRDKSKKRNVFFLEVAAAKWDGLPLRRWVGSKEHCVMPRSH
jgi:hypothetical protein